MRRALVTGASRGIGAAIARRLAADGHRVVLLARGAADLATVADDIRATGGQADVVAHDLVDADGIEAALAPVLAEGAIDVLVSNAGGNVRKAATDYDLAEWDALHALALRAPFRLAQLCQPGMASSGFGRIVHIGSVAGARALPTGAPYAAAKAGLAQLTRSLAREWGPLGISTNCVAPWYVETSLTEGVLSDPGFRETVLRCTPSGRLGTPEDVAALVAFLAGDASAWLNGAVIPLDGGFTGAAFFPPA